MSQENDSKRKNSLKTTTLIRCFEEVLVRCLVLVVRDETKKKLELIWMLVFFFGSPRILAMDEKNHAQELFE